MHWAASVKAHRVKSGEALPGTVPEGWGIRLVSPPTTSRCRVFWAAACGTLVLYLYARGSLSGCSRWPCACRSWLWAGLPWSRRSLGPPKPWLSRTAARGSSGSRFPRDCSSAHLWRAAAHPQAPRPGVHHVSAKQREDEGRHCEEDGAVQHIPRIAGMFEHHKEKMCLLSQCCDPERSGGGGRTPVPPVTYPFSAPPLLWGEWNLSQKRKKERQVSWSSRSLEKLAELSPSAVVVMRWGTAAALRGDSRAPAHCAGSRSSGDCSGNPPQLPTSKQQRSIFVPIKIVCICPHMHC